MEFFHIRSGLVFPLRTPLSDENQMLGWIQTIVLILIIILNLLYVLNYKELIEDTEVPYLLHILQDHVFGQYF